MLAALFIYGTTVAAGFTFLLCLPQMCGGLPAAADNAGGGAQERSDRLAQGMSLTHSDSGITA
jgi:hypothetical protein